MRVLTEIVAVALLAAGALPSSAAPAAVSKLRCEYAVNPLGIDVPRPRLSWVIESARRGEIQTAYQVLVASSEEALAQDRGDLWDSGKAASDQSIHVVYGGRELGSRQRAHWKVRMWDREGQPSPYSAPAWWEMGLLRSEDWKAQWIALPPGQQNEKGGPRGPRMAGVPWIWYPEGNPSEDAPTEERYFRRRLDLPADRTIQSAQFVLTADDRFTLYLNGREAGSGAVWNQLFLFDVKGFLVPGPNLIAVAAANGGGPAGLIGKLRVEFESGDAVEFATSADWKAHNRKPAGWETAAFDDASWAAARELVRFGQAPWEGMEEGQARGAITLGPTPFFRKSFVLAKPVRHARLYATALGVYELRLNGRRVGDEVLSPGWTDYHIRVQVQTYDVTPMLREGGNALGMVLGDGWYAGYVGWGKKRGHYGPHPWALAQLEVTTADGVTEVVATDGAWKASTGPLLESDLLMGETYDARKEMPGWDAPGFDDAAWRPVSARAADAPRLVAEIGPPMRRTQELPARSVAEPAPGAFVFDLGQNMVGWARLKVKGPAGASVTLRFAEMLNPDGTIYITNLRAARCTDRYILKGEGEEVFEPRFTFHGFRYVEVTGYPGRPPLEAVTGIVVHSDTPPAGTFECSHPMVNQLQRNIVWGQRGNFLSIPTDCPQRDERLGWMGDAQIFVRAACFNMDVAGFFTKWMIDVEDAQSPEGAFPDVAPRKTHNSDGAPAWGDAGVIVPWTIYRCYGDARILERHYGAMAKWIEYIRSANPDGIWSQRIGNDYGDWVSVPLNSTPKEVVATAFYAHSTRLMARAARALGRADDARRYEDLFQAIRIAFQREFVDSDGRIWGRPREVGRGKRAKEGENGLRGNTQACYVLALRFDLLAEDKREAAVRYLVEDIEKRGGHLSTGFLGVGHILPVLTDGGRLDAAYRLLLNETFPSWGYSIRQGATTIWERWDGWTAEKGFQDPGMNSFNHYSFGSVGEWMAAVVAGIDLDPEAPGYKRFVIRPRPGGGLTRARGAYESIHGRIVSDWSVEGGRFTLRAEIPANTAATVHIPAADAEAVTEGGAPADRAEGVRLLRREGGAALYEVGSGTYEFRAGRP